MKRCWLNIISVFHEAWYKSSWIIYVFFIKIETYLVSTVWCFVTNLCCIETHHYGHTNLDIKPDWQVEHLNGFSIDWSSLELFEDMFFVIFAQHRLANTLGQYVNFGNILAWTILDTIKDTFFAHLKWLYWSISSFILFLLFQFFVNEMF